MLQNAYFLVEIGADTAELHLHSVEMLPIGLLDEDESFDSDHTANADEQGGRLHGHEAVVHCPNW